MHYKIYVILAHKNPKQLGRLINLIMNENTFCFIHLDKKVDIKLFEHLSINNDVHFVNKRVVCHWGKYSLVQATINAFNEVYDFIENKSLNSYHCILLSGQDLPLTSNINIDNFLFKNKEVSFFHYWSLPYDKWWDGGMFRILNLYFFDFQKFGKQNRMINKLIRRLGMQSILPFNRLKSFDSSIEIYGSSQWFILNHKALESMVNNEVILKNLGKAFKYSFAPDELLFITFFKYIQEKEMLNIKNKQTTFVKFDAYEPNPKFLEIRDVKQDFQDHILFGRKFDDSKNPETIEFIEKQIKP